MGEYYHTKESVEEYIHLAKDVNGRQLINQLEQVLPKKSTLLEIGSGPGTDWNILNKIYTVTGSDNSAKFIDHLTSNNPNGEFLELDAVTLNTDKKYDGIFSNKVMHHLTDDQLTGSIKRQHEILNDKGVLCHSFWKGEGTEIFKGMFVNYHLEEEIRKFFEPLFEILFLDSYAEFDAGDSILLIGRKN
ncbi:MAG: methyltransferase [Crocinitomicaceae bacterium]|nr:methyltransferase [Crocinitomicaceae bacterium]|tara:strand:- start:4230 stop:4796 length:567 start_codon:yes stop_codon:yes gene_type:complete